MLCRAGLGWDWGGLGLGLTGHADADDGHGLHRHSGGRLGVSVRCLDVEWDVVVSKCSRSFYETQELAKSSLELRC